MPTMPFLRDLPNTTPFRSDEYQYGDVFEKQASLGKRTLTANEKLALALNEIAVEKGAGFFMYLPARMGLHAKPRTMPGGRWATSVGRNYCELVFMRFAWDPASIQVFNQATPRERLLRCGYFINPPPDETPLYPIQVSSFGDAQMFVASFPSLALYSSHQKKLKDDDPPRVYFLAEAGVVEKIVTANTSTGAKRKARQLRLAKYLNGEEPGNEVERNRLGQMQEYKLRTLDDLYERIINTCRYGGQTSVAAGEFRKNLNCPLQRQEGISLGDSELESSADPPSRREKPLPGARRAPA